MEFEVCKVGSAADFTFAVNGAPAGSFSLADGQCSVIHTHTTMPFRTVSVTETGAANAVLDSIVVFEFVGNFQTDPIIPTKTVLTGTNTASGRVGLEGGSLLVFYNRLLPPPEGGEGCTPGYWKQPHHFDSWPAPYTPTTLFSSVFDDAFPGMTLVQVLGQGGGGLKALGRHTVAALLNAASGGVDYDLTVQQVIDGFNAAYPGGDIEGTKNRFEGFNQQGCPLN
ncbi:MAG TPA: hypothetical protein VNK43_05360 [Gemmatimonadales bacterium]|nr:hypothetical protein [Gemmatimonadales bacterium]